MQNKNFSGTLIAGFAPVPGETVRSCNFAQTTPHTLITDVSGLTFDMCNLTNCALPADAIVTGMLPVQISYCGHLHAGIECADDCEHLVSREDIVVDGEVVDSIRAYEDKVVI